MLHLRSGGHLMIPLHYGHMTPAMRRSHDLIFRHLLYRSLVLLLTRLLLIASMLGLPLLCDLPIGPLPRLLLGGLSLGTLLRLALHFDLRRRLTHRALRTRLLGRTRRLRLSRLLLALVRGISLPIVLARLALGTQAYFLASESALDGRLGLGGFATLTALF